MGCYDTGDFTQQAEILKLHDVFGRASAQVLLVGHLATAVSHTIQLGKIPASFPAS